MYRVFKAVLTPFPTFGDKTVAKRSLDIVVITSGIIAGFLFLFAPATAAQKTSVGRGELRAVDILSQTVVVEVYLENRLLTVGGPLSKDAELKVDGAKSKLHAFSVGEVVTVGWRLTAEGHEITLLEASRPAAMSSTKGLFHYVPGKTVIGNLQIHRVRKKETLLDIARHYHLGFNEIEDLYPNLDPWIPPEGLELTIPSQWVLPGTIREGIVINVPEMRLYYFTSQGKNTKVETFPVGIGDIDWPTPLGSFKIKEKRKNPAWLIPPSLRHKYNVIAIPPGPDNPLGDYWMGLAHSKYGIHGTDIPWSIGRLVTRGCIRLYPEDIQNLFEKVDIGTPVVLIYEPVKIGRVSEKIYVEVHRDIYGRIDHFEQYGYKKLQERSLSRRVDMNKFDQAAKRRNGMPVDVTLTGS